MSEAQAETAPQNPDETGRDESGRFAPGTSGNKGGRPKGLARAVRELVGEDGRALAQFWANVMTDDNAAARDRIAASKLLAERGWGKPPEYMPMDVQDPLELEEQELRDAAGHFDAEVIRLSERRRTGDGPQGDGTKK